MTNALRPSPASTFKNAQPKPTPTPMPTAAPNNAICTDSIVINNRICRRCIPTARNIPISCLRSITFNANVFTMPNVATNTDNANSAYRIYSI